MCSGYRLVSKSNEDVGVNRSGHRSRSSRNHSDDGLSASRNPEPPNAAIFFKRTLGSHWPNADFAAVFLEKQFVTGANAQSTANLVRHRALSLACDSRLLFQNDLLFLTLRQTPLLYGSAEWQTVREGGKVA